jgi:hypothetical protein
MQKKKFDVVVDPNVVQEHEGFKVGQEVYCLRFPDKQTSRGMITDIHLDEKIGAYHTFICDITGQFRKALFSDTVSTPTPKMKSAVEKLIAKVKKQDQAAADKRKDK